MLKTGLYCMLLLLACSFTAVKAQREYGGYYTRERLTHARNNCNNLAWAQQIRANAIKLAAPWVQQSDSALWHMVPGQDLPRCIDVTFDRVAKGPKFLGCLQCGDKIAAFGNYPYNPDIVNQPWKLTCPSCHAIFPTNDFGKYYQSGIDEHGLFNPQQADKKLLFNTAHPDPADPLHKYGVDDGFGYINAQGRAYRFIGYYVWKYWDHIMKGLAALSDAFVYTGDQVYAHKAAILLDRIADVYPSMDWKPYADKGWYHSDGGSNKGKIGGSIWETSTAQLFAEAADKIISGTVNDEALYVFLRKMSQRYQLPTAKGSRALWVQNIDEGILRTTYRSVLNEQIRGNQGMHQLSVAKAAIALNTQPESTAWLDWLFAPEGGAIPGLMVGTLDHDGMSNEGAPGYAFIWGRLMAGFGELLRGYAGYTNHDIFKEFPQLRATYTAAYRMSALGRAMPNLGDAGATGLVSPGGDANFMAKGFSWYNDPAIALAAYRANGNSVKGLGLQVFEKDPEALNKRIAQIAKDAAPVPVKTHLMSGFGLAFLQSGTAQKGISLAFNYGRTIMHAHPDLLNFDLFAFGHWLAPDHGYPEFATQWPSNQQWTGTTISHNLVLVNKRPQKEVWGGHTRLFKQVPGFSVVEIDGRPAYPETQTYSRTLMLVGGESLKDSNAYVVDIFRVDGGNDHVYGFHGVPGEVTHQGLKLTVQPTGTYAGDTIAKGAVAGNFPIGYSHLYQVERDQQPPAQFYVDWKAAAGYRGVQAQDSIHIRLHALTACSDIALANGDPPQNKAGNPKTLRYVLMHRTGGQLQSTFVNIIEPYRNRPFIRSVNRLDAGSGAGVALQINRTDGTVDYILYNSDESQVLQLKNGMQLKGSVGWLQQTAGKPVKAVLVNGSLLRYDKKQLSGAAPYTGTIKKMNRELEGGGWVLVDTPLPADGSLTGEQLIIQTRGERDATYTIERVERQGELTRIYCGPITFISDYKSEKVKIRLATIPKDYTSGFVYDFEEGDAFRITNHRVAK